jgi:transforming growth factor-beta-induced protein
VAALALTTLGACTDDSSESAKHPATTSTAPADKVSGSILDHLRTEPGLATTARLAEKAKLAGRLGAGGQLTFFAPTDAAWKALGASKLRQLEGSSDALSGLLDRLVAPSRLTAADLVRLNGKTFDSLGGKVPVAIDGRTLKVDGATVSRTDLMTTNGVIHVIDAIPAQ